MPGSDLTLTLLSAFLGIRTLAGPSALTLAGPAAFTLATPITGSVAFRPFTVSVRHSITSLHLLFDVHDMHFPYYVVDVMLPMLWIRTHEPGTWEEQPEL